MKIKLTLVMIALIAFVTIGTSSLIDRDNKIKLQNIEIQDTSTKLKILDEKYKKLNNDLDHKTKTLQQVEEERKKLEQEKQELSKQLSAKQEAQRLASLEAKIVEAIVPTASAQPINGDCQSWIEQAGITDTYHANLLIGGESGCNPGAVNPSSGACGIPQSLPCSKMGCSLDDPVCQLKWMQTYVINRYGSWSNAYATWQSRSPHWY